MPVYVTVHCNTRLAIGTENTSVHTDVQHQEFSYNCEAEVGTSTLEDYVIHYNEYIHASEKATSLSGLQEK